MTQEYTVFTKTTPALGMGFFPRNGEFKASSLVTATAADQASTDSPAIEVGEMRWEITDDAYSHLAATGVSATMSVRAGFSGDASYESVHRRFAEKRTASVMAWIDAYFPDQTRVLALTAEAKALQHEGKKELFLKKSAPEYINVIKRGFRLALSLDFTFSSSSLARTVVSAARGEYGPARGAVGFSLASKQLSQSGRYRLSVTANGVPIGNNDEGLFGSESIAKLRAAASEEDYDLAFRVLEEMAKSVSYASCPVRVFGTTPLISVPGAIWSYEDARPQPDDDRLRNLAKIYHSAVNWRNECFALIEQLDELGRFTERAGELLLEKYSSYDAKASDARLAANAALVGGASGSVLPALPPNWEGIFKRIARFSGWQAKLGAHYMKPRHGGDWRQIRLVAYLVPHISVYAPENVVHVVLESMAPGSSWSPRGVWNRYDPEAFYNTLRAPIEPLVNQRFISAPSPGGGDAGKARELALVRNAIAEHGQDLREGLVAMIGELEFRMTLTSPGFEEQLPLGRPKDWLSEDGLAQWNT